MVKPIFFRNPAIMEALMPDMFTTSSEVTFSPCKRYRYRLKRDLGRPGKTIAWFGVNPSTADAENDDATVKKWIGFSSRAGAGSFIVGNGCAWRATDVKELKKVDDPIGPENGHHIQAICNDADILVPCWGDLKKVPSDLHTWFEHLADVLLATGKPVKCLGYTKDGDPLHPLMVPYEQKLLVFNTGMKS